MPVPEQRQGTGTADAVRPPRRQKHVSHRERTSPLEQRSGDARRVTRIGVKQQQRRAALCGCIRQTATVLADDRFDRVGSPAQACALATIRLLAVPDPDDSFSR
jgi:hypothetical protein